MSSSVRLMMNGVWKTKNLHSHLVDIVMASVGSLEWGIVIGMYKPDNEAGKVTLALQAKTMELMEGHGPSRGCPNHHGKCRKVKRYLYPWYKNESYK